MNNNRKKILIGVGAIAFLIGCKITFDYFMYVATDNAQVEGHSVLLAAKVGGYVLKVNVLDGQKVKKDEVLAEIDSRDYENTVKQAAAELAGIEARKSDIEKNYARTASLFASGSVSQQQYDAAAAARGDIKARFESVSAALNQAQLNLENTKIKAPTDGFIAKSSVEVGQLASPGVPLFGFVDSNERWITANFKETEIEDIHLGRAVFIDVDAVTGTSFKGVVESVSSATGATFTLLPPDNATGNFTKVVQRVPVKIKIEGLTAQDIELLRAGLSAYVRVRKH